MSRFHQLSAGKTWNPERSSSSTTPPPSWEGSELPVGPDLGVPGSPVQPARRSSPRLARAPAAPSRGLGRPRIETVLSAGVANRVCGARSFDVSRSLHRLCSRGLGDLSGVTGPRGTHAERAERASPDRNPPGISCLLFSPVPRSIVAPPGVPQRTIQLASGDGGSCPCSRLGTRGPNALSPIPARCMRPWGPHGGHRFRHALAGQGSSADLVSAQLLQRSRRP
jgi:hypothetical protein